MLTSNGSEEWSPLSTARTVSEGKIASDEDNEDEVATVATARAREIKREIVRKSVDDIESAICGIGAIYKFQKTLGQGSFAIVKEAKHKETGALVAIKIIEKVDGDDFEEREIGALGKINHPNCVTLLEVFESSRKIYLVTELMTGGTVMDRIIAESHFSEKDAATAMVDVLHAVQYIHEIGLVHRDLKLENLMYASNDPQSPDYHTVKGDMCGVVRMVTIITGRQLVDFGFAKTIRQMSYMKTQCGSPWNVAPEVLDPELEHKQGYGPEVDLWAVGVILYSMLCGFPPFYNENNNALVGQILRGDYKFHSPYWDEVSFGAKDLVASLLVVDPCRRFTCHQSLEHPWIKNAVDASSKKLHSSYRSFILLRKLAIFRDMEPACLEEVSGRLQAVTVAAGEWVIRAGEAGDAMYFIDHGAVQVALEGFQVDKLGAGNFFGELALTSAEERCADVVSIGSTGGVRCDADGSPVGRRRVDPTELFKLTRADFEEVVARFPALKERLHRVGTARVERACIESPQGSPLRNLYQRGFGARGRRGFAAVAAAAAALRNHPIDDSVPALGTEQYGGSAVSNGPGRISAILPPAPGEAELLRRASDALMETEGEVVEEETQQLEAEAAATAAGPAGVQGSAIWAAIGEEGGRETASLVS